MGWNSNYDINLTFAARLELSGFVLIHLRIDWVMSLQLQKWPLENFGRNFLSSGTCIQRSLVCTGDLPSNKKLLVATRALLHRALLHIATSKKRLGHRY